MTKDEVMARLRAHEAELRAAGVDALWLFGSVARGDARADSDVDLMFERDMSRPFTLLDRVALKQRTERLLDRPVDIGQRVSLVEPARSHADADAIRVF